MKILRLLTWVFHFGLSAIIPPCFFLWLAVYLRQNYDWGILPGITGVILGILISFRTTKANWRAMRKEAESGTPPPHVSYNDHN